MTPGNVVLIGFMGVGKSAVARELGRMMGGYRVVELDTLIEERTGRTIPAIFTEDGEVGFRDIERDLLQSVLSERGQVISTGGGAVIRQENRDAIRRSGYAVLLTALPETILKRTNESGVVRPLLMSDDPLSKIRALLSERDHMYREVAEAVVDTEGRTPMQIAGEIMEALKWTG